MNKERLQACSHYCEHKKQAVFGKSANKIDPYQNIKTLIKTRLSFIVFVYRFLRSIYGLLSYHFFRLPLCRGIFHKTYCANNKLGILITTKCNLGCFNCQISAGQAPANDMMSLRQMEGFVNEAINLRYYWDCIHLTGGEPTFHPQFSEILDVLKRYKQFNPKCKIELETNGVGKKVQSLLKKMPDWVMVCNSRKKEGKKDYAFFTYNIAPIDTLTYRLFPYFSRGCKRIDECYGLCISMYGYYPCSPCMNVDRVFGFDIGIKKLSLVTEEALRAQMKILCKYCGWFKEPVIEKIFTEKVSRSWRKAFAKYRKQKPRLSLYV